MIGIYKIISPTNKIYVGQSTNILNRFNNYKNLKHCKNQRRLYNSLKKYGYNNHIFEILEKCSESELNNRERYYQDLYNVIGRNGLNCRLTKSDEKSGKMSEKTKLKISLANSNPSNEIRLKRSKSRIGMKFSESHKNNLKISRAKQIISEETKLKMSISTKTCKKVINIETNEIYHSVRYAAKMIGINPRTLQHWLNGTRSNKSVYRYL